MLKILYYIGLVLTHTLRSTLFVKEVITREINNNDKIWDPSGF